jgi:hypothetical protein
MDLGRLAPPGLRGHRRTYLTILERAADLKMVWYVLLHSGLTSGHDFFFVIETNILLLT